jgi:Uma2 family endonuclease
MLFSRQVGDRALVWTQNPIAAPPRSEPQPDVALLSPRPDRYRDSLPTPNDVLLLVEVADTTLQYDRAVKLPLYARHSIGEVWIVNLPEPRLEIHRDPQDGAYRSREERSAADTASPAALPNVDLTLRELLAD